MSESQRITLSCPMCSRKHTFPVTIKRDVVFGFRTRRREAPQARSFTRLFVCPTKAEQFQGKLTFSESSDEPIIEVTVGMAEPDE
jgi:hypothetical protein